MKTVWRNQKKDLSRFFAHTFVGVGEDPLKNFGMAFSFSKWGAVPICSFFFAFSSPEKKTIPCPIFVPLSFLERSISVYTVIQ